MLSDVSSVVVFFCLTLKLNKSCMKKVSFVGLSWTDLDLDLLVVET